MNIGLGLSLRSGGAPSAAPAFDITTLAHTGLWWDYANVSPYVGVASAGTSANQNAVESGASKPAAGTALNARGVADFNGTSHFFIPDDTLDTYYDADGYGGWALLNVDAIDTNDATANGAIENDALFAALTGYHAIYLRSAGGSGGGPVAGISHYASGPTYTNAITDIALSAWFLLHWRYVKLPSPVVQIGVNGTWGSAVATPGDLNAAAMTLGLRMGRNYVNTKYFDGKKAAMGLFDFSPTDTDIANIKSGVNSRWALSL